MPAPSQVSKPPIHAGDHLILVDGSGFIFRAFHALPPHDAQVRRPARPARSPASATWSGSCCRRGRRAAPGDEPTHFAVIFDYSAKTFRNELYAEYKAHRPEPPSDLIPQFGLIRQATRAFNLACIEQEGWEADDLIATYACQAREAGATVTIVSSDKDLMQIVRPGVIMVDTMKNVVIDREGGEGEVRRLSGEDDRAAGAGGDSTDNVPGVPGIGPKTAAQLLDEYGDLETLLARAGEIKQPKRRERPDRIRRAGAHLAQARDALLRRAARRAARRPRGGGRRRSRSAVGFLKALEFTTLTRRVAEKTGADADSHRSGGARHRGLGAAGGPAHGPAWACRERAGAERRQRRGGPLPAGRRERAGGSSRRRDDQPRSARPPTRRGSRRSAACEPKLDARQVSERSADLDDLERWIATAAERGFVAIDAADDAAPTRCRRRSAASRWRWRPAVAAYVPLGHREGDGDGIFRRRRCDANGRPDRAARRRSARRWPSRSSRTRRS